MTEEPPVKKGRGRPKKNVVNVEDNGQEVKKAPTKEKPVAVAENGDSEGTEEEVPVSPPKSASKKRQAAPVSEPADDGSDNEEEAPAPAKRGRGRPRKTAKVASSKSARREKAAAASKASPQVTGRGRGRPKKNA